MSAPVETVPAAAVEEPKVEAPAAEAVPEVAKEVRQRLISHLRLICSLVFSLIHQSPAAEPAPEATPAAEAAVAEPTTETPAATEETPVCWACHIKLTQWLILLIFNAQRLVGHHRGDSC